MRAKMEVTQSHFGLFQMTKNKILAERSHMILAYSSASSSGPLPDQAEARTDSD